MVPGAVFRRTHPLHPCKRTVETGEMGKAALIPEILDRPVGMAELMHGMIDVRAREEVVEVTPGFPLERPAEMVRRKDKMLRQIPSSDTRPFPDQPANLLNPPPLIYLALRRPRPPYPGTNGPVGNRRTDASLSASPKRGKGESMERRRPAVAAADSDCPLTSAL